MSERLKHTAWSDIPPEQLNPLLTRQFVHGDQAMLSRIQLQKGCIVPWHSHPNEQIVFILSGNPALVTDQGEFELLPGMCVGFKAGTGDAHHLINRSSEDVLYIEVGDRTAGDSASYPDDDLQAVVGEDGKLRFLHKDGRPY